MLLLCIYYIMKMSRVDEKTTSINGKKKNVITCALITPYTLQTGFLKLDGEYLYAAYMYIK